MRTWINKAALGMSLALIVGGTGLAKGPSLGDEKSCGEYGTSVHFESTPVEAARAAKKEGKLVIVLHVSGHFEDPGLT